MKYTLFFIFCCLFSVSALATDTATLTKQVQRAAQVHLTPNVGAIKNNSRLDFYITERLDYPGRTVYGPYRADLACKSYALDSHWLIVAGTCMRVDNSDIWEYGDSQLITRFDREVFQKNGTEFTTFKNNARVMLVWSDQAQYRGPFVNVLAVSSPKQLVALEKTHTVKINTARYGRDGVRTREFDTTSAHGNYFKLDESWTQLSGTATDPLFLIAPNENEFLAGYNDGYVHYNYLRSLNDLIFPNDGLPSDTWYSLTQEDLHFIRHTVREKRPQDWERIKARLFYETTSAPYFE